MVNVSVNKKIITMPQFQNAGVAVSVSCNVGITIDNTSFNCYKRSNIEEYSFRSKLNSCIKIGKTIYSSKMKKRVSLCILSFV